MPSFLDRALDASVVLGYTKPGYLVRRVSMDPIDDDLTGRTIVVTGATSGLGEAAATELARLGARVVVVGRNPDKVERVVASLGAPSTGEVADLSLLGATRDLAERLLASEPRIDVLVNNAGVLLPERSVTAEGLETSVATNVVSHFLLTNLLVPRMRESAPARIVNVSSGGMYTQPLNVDHLLDGQGEWNGAAAYARAKRAQVVLTELWAERLEGSGVVVHSMHPGWANTAGVKSGIPTFHTLARPFLRTASQGADTIVWLAAADEPAESSGLFWHDREPRPTHRFSRTEERPGERQRLWNTLADLTGTGTE